MKQSPSSVYELMCKPGFPVLQVGSCMVVARSSSSEWKNTQREVMEHEKARCSSGIAQARSSALSVCHSQWCLRTQTPPCGVLAYLSYSCLQVHDKGKKSICVQAVAGSFHRTTATAEKYPATLVSKDLDAVDGTLTPRRATRKFFSLPNEVFLMTLPSSAFLGCVYLLYCEDRRTH